MRENIGSHPSEDALELWALGRCANQSEAEEIQQHLLVCHACRVSVDVLTVEASEIRDALKASSKIAPEK